MPTMLMFISSALASACHSAAAAAGVHAWPESASAETETTLIAVPSMVWGRVNW